MGMESMRKNQLKIKMYSRKLDAYKNIMVDIVDGKPLRFGKPIYCSCTGDDVDSATMMGFDGSDVYCPVCGNKSVEVYTYEDYLKDEEVKKKIARENICLNKYEHSWETGITYYKLSTRVEYEDWLKIKKYFQYYTMEDNVDDETISGRPILGWVTTNPEKVEELLEIPYERTLKYREEKEAIKKEESEKKKEELEHLIEECKSYFVNVEVPEGSFELDGVKVENPVFPHNIYGGGEWWIIEDEFIWFVKNNGFDGANWSWNNVKTSGAGAIGRRIPFDEGLYEKLMRLSKL